MMKTRNFVKNTVLYGLLIWTSAAFSHVVLEEPTALAGRNYRATLRVGHGCDGSPTTAIKVYIPTGFQGAKPMPKPGWNLTTTLTQLEKPYKNHGKVVTEDVAEITWSASTKDHWLPDSHYDEFVLRGGLPETAGALWFKVLQICDKGSNAWVEVPSTGTSTQGLKAPAALLEVMDSHAPRHQH